MIKLVTENWTYLKLVNKGSQIYLGAKTLFTNRESVKPSIIVADPLKNVYLKYLKFSRLKWRKFCNFCIRIKSKF